MSFYQQIAPYYHHIFKINNNQLNFIKSKIPNSDSNVLDIGCGIGTLSFELANYYKKVRGVDVDAEMIRVALKQKERSLSLVEFEQLGMLELKASVAGNTLDGIICFGNTLVHLSNLEEVANFLKQAKAILKPTGKLLLQIVNYDRIIDKNIQQLPLIDNDEIIFERHYDYHVSENKIDFNTRLTVKASQKIIENSITLLPVLKAELVLLLKEAGFNHGNYYGNYTKEGYTINSPALILEAW